MTIAMFKLFFLIETVVRVNYVLQVQRITFTPYIRVFLRLFERLVYGGLLSTVCLWWWSSLWQNVRKMPVSSVFTWLDRDRLWQRLKFHLVFEILVTLVKRLSINCDSFMPLKRGHRLVGLITLVRSGFRKLYM